MRLPIVSFVVFHNLKPLLKNFNLSMGHCIVFLGQPFYSHSASVNPAPVVQRVDNAIHRVNHYSVDSEVGFV